MIPVGVLGQIYFACAGLGIVFFTFILASGQLDDGTDDGGGGADGSDGGDGATADGDGPWGAGHTIHAGGRMAVAASIANGFGSLIMHLPSPLGLSCFLMFFGLTGIACLDAFKWLGLLTLVPSFMVAWLVQSMLKNVIRLMVRHLQSSSHIRTSDIIGQIASVNVPIHDGRTGEVVYTVRSKRVSCAALPFKEGVHISKGQKVLIVESKGHTVLVQPYDQELQDVIN